VSLYSISLFLHIVGALALCAALGLEWASVYGLRRAPTTGQARAWLGLLSAQRFVGGPAALIVLITGIHLSATRWGPQGWIVVGLAAMVAIAVLGPALGARPAAAIARALPIEDAPISAALGPRLRDPVLARSISLRTALFLGIVFLMSNKPGVPGALTAMGVALVLGLAPGTRNWSGGPRTARIASDPTASSTMRG
jgi:hypothetical protein